MSTPTERGDGGVPVRVQRRRSAGWRMPAGAVYVGRPTRWGNPHRVNEHGPAERSRFTRRSYRPTLPGWPRCGLSWGGRDLACWCPPGRPCHADVLLEVANSRHGEDHDGERQAREADR